MHYTLHTHINTGTNAYLKLMHTPLPTPLHHCTTAYTCRWALFPPGTRRHAVLPKEEGIEKEAVSWFTRGYPRTQRDDWPTARPIDIIQVGHAC